MATEGYAAIADYFDHDRNIPILRRFRRLNVLNLLYMQAELFHLERELQSIAEEDATSSDQTRQDFAYSILNLRASAETVDGFQWEKILEIRTKLEEYSMKDSTLFSYHGVC